MLAARLRGNQQVSVEEVPDPQIQQADECLVQVMACGICGSDVHPYLAATPREDVLGHEAAGEVVAVGEGVSRLKIGDRVVVYSLIGCGTCPYCLQGRVTYCREPGGSLGGGFGELLVAPERSLWPLPDDLSYERGCLFSDVLGTPHKALRLAGVGERDTVVVFGCGPIGLGAVQIAVAKGARVMAVDLLDYRLAAAASLGAEVVCNGGEQDAAQQAFEWTCVGADLALDCTGAPGVALQALSAVRPGGRAICVGWNVEMTLNPAAHLMKRDVILTGSFYLHPEDYFECLDLYRRTGLDPLRLVTHRVPLEDIGRGFDVFCNHKENCIKVIVLLGPR